MTFIEHLLSTRISQYFHLTSESQYPLLENMVFNSCATILPEWGWNPKMLCLMNFDPKRVLQVVVVGGMVGTTVNHHCPCHHEIPLVSD